MLITAVRIERTHHAVQGYCYCHKPPQEWWKVRPEVWHVAALEYALILTALWGRRLAGSRRSDPPVHGGQWTLLLPSAVMYVGGCVLEAAG